MKVYIQIVGAILAVLILAVLVLPIGIHVGKSDPTSGATPSEEGIEVGRTYKTEIVCRYFVQTAFEDMPVWTYSGEVNPPPPACDFLTLYWHSGWLVSPDLSLF